MEGLFIYLTAVNISEISEKTASATLRILFLCQNLQIKVRYIVAHRYARFKVKSKLCIFK